MFGEVILSGKMKDACTLTVQLQNPVQFGTPDPESRYYGRARYILKCGNVSLKMHSWLRGHLIQKFLNEVAGLVDGNRTCAVLLDEDYVGTLRFSWADPAVRKHICIAGRNGAVLLSGHQRDWGRFTPVDPEFGDDPVLFRPGTSVVFNGLVVEVAQVQGFTNLLSEYIRTSGITLGGSPC